MTPLWRKLWIEIPNLTSFTRSLPKFLIYFFIYFHIVLPSPGKQDSGVQQVGKPAEHSDYHHSLPLVSVNMDCVFIKL